VGEVGGALDGLKRVRRVGAGVAVVAGRRHVQRAAGRLRQRVRAGGERGRGRAAAGHAVGVGERHSHFVRGRRRQREQAADEAGGVDPDQRMGGLERSAAGDSPLERGGGIAVVVAADHRDHAASVDRAVRRHRRQGDGIDRQRASA
jgi:hypothetical protein